MMWVALVKAKVRGELQYRASFAFGLFAQVLVNAVDLIGLWAIFQATRFVAGWSPAQCLWLFGTSTMAFGLADLFISPIEDLAEHIRTGRFDSYLLRPTRILPTVIADGFELRRLGRVIVGAVCCVLMIVRPDWFGLERTIGSLGGTTAVIVVGFVIYGAVFVATNSISFWLVDSREVANAFTYGGSAASRYPLDALSSWVRRLFLWVVPIGFVSWLPGVRVLGAPQARGLPTWISYMSPVAAGCCVAVAGLIWRAGVRRYESTGS
jgi:ABC-2 type transport system permease protein